RNIIDRVALLLSSVRHRTLHSFPTRRSSDLDQEDFRHSRVANQPQTAPIEWLRLPLSTAELTDFALYTGHSGQSPEPDRLSMLRSEEHTSELQSRENLVCRLLLEKKNEEPRC